MAAAGGYWKGGNFVAAREPASISLSDLRVGDQLLRYGSRSNPYRNSPYNRPIMNTVTKVNRATVSFKTEWAQKGKYSFKDLARDLEAFDYRVQRGSTEYPLTG